MSKLIFYQFILEDPDIVVSNKSWSVWSACELIAPEIQLKDLVGSKCGNGFQYSKRNKCLLRGTG